MNQEACSRRKDQDVVTKRTHIDPSPLFGYLDARGIQYAWLAEQLGVSKAFLTNIKAGRDRVPVNFPERVSKILAIPAFMLFDNLPDGSDERAREEVSA